MVATDSQEQAMDLIRAHSPYVPSVLHDHVWNILITLQTPDALSSCLRNADSIDTLVDYFRHVAVNSLNDPNITTTSLYTTEEEIALLTELFHCGLCITPESGAYHSMRNDRGLTSHRTNNFLVIRRKQKHYDLLIPQNLLNFLAKMDVYLAPFPGATR